MYLFRGPGNTYFILLKIHVLCIWKSLFSVPENTSFVYLEIRISCT